MENRPFDSLPAPEGASLRPYEGIGPFNNLSLQAARKLLMMDVSEAAEEIGKVSNRTWQYWEAGRYNIPTDVAIELERLLELRMEKIGEVDDMLAAVPVGEKVKIRYYLTFEQFQQDHPDARKTDWRISQSVAALYFTEGMAELY